MAEARRWLETLGPAVVEQGPPTPGLVVELARGLRVAEGAFRPPAAGAASTIVPPGAAAWSTPEGWGLATDALGVHDVYWRQGSGWAAVSTSAVALGLLEWSGPDDDALGVTALVGHPVGSGTAVAQVVRLRPGEVCEIRAGRASITGGTPALPPAGRSWLTDDRAVRRTGAEALRGIVGEALEDAGEVVLELSGGLDSRVLLAAIPPDRRAGLTAVTLGPPDSPDALIASEIARRWKLEHRLIDLRGLAELSADEAEALATTVGARLDWSGNPVALAVLAWAEAQIADDRPRLSGQNGEFARGFYYALLPRWTPNTRRTVDALGRWRVFANDRVDPDVLAPALTRRAEETALAELRHLVPAGNFLAATDELYLTLRMTRWLGPAYTLASRSRVVHAPFLDGRYLTWARSLHPSRRRDSRALAGVLAELDPELASLPLASGASPSTLAAGGLRSKGSAIPRTGRKVAAKVRQRVRPRPRSAEGARALAELVRTAWSARDGALDAAATSPLVRPEVVREIARGRRPADPTTVGFLVALEHLGRTSGDAAREPAVSRPA
jgi:asparagine synthase (glutamine-hydrolysing)